MMKKIIILITLIFISGCKIEGGGGSAGGLSSQYDEETIAMFLSSLSESGTSNFTIDDLPANITFVYDPIPQDNTSAPVPEPATLSLLGLGLAGLLLKKKKIK